MMVASAILVQATQRDFRFLNFVRNCNFLLDKPHPLILSFSNNGQLSGRLTHPMPLLDQQNGMYSSLYNRS